MDIAALSSTLCQQSQMQQAGVDVLKKALDNSQSSSQELVKLMEQSVKPCVGANIDIRL